MTTSIPEADAQHLVARSAPRIARKASPRLGRILALEDFEPLARAYLPRPIFGFIAGAAERNASLSANSESFADWSFVPRVLVDTTVRTQRTELFGQSYAAPFGIPPMGGTAVAAYRGDLVLARAAARADIPFILSGSSLIRMEEVRAAGRTAWFQAYLPGEPERIAALMDRAAAAGFDTFVLTVDLPVPGNRENNERNGWSMPLNPTPRLAWQGITRPRWLAGTFARTLRLHGMPHFENMDAGRGPPIVSRNLVRAVGRRDGLSWSHVAEMRRRWRGRFVIKGILAGEDARIAREHGVDGIMVSNHGGRQLDGAVAPLRALPEVVDKAGDMTVMLDGGVRRGSDVLKALALGARFVFVGRPFLYAAAIGGEEAVDHAIGLLSEEVDRNMALLGITAPRDMTRDYLRPVPGRG